MDLGLRRLDLGPNMYGKGTWELVREENLSSKNTLKLFRSIFLFLEKKSKTAEGRDLLNFSFPLFWKGCSKRWPVIRQQRIHMEEGHEEHPNPKGSQLLFRAELLQDCHETKAQRFFVAYKTFSKWNGNFCCNRTTGIFLIFFFFLQRNYFAWEKILMAPWHVSARSQ